MDNLLSMEVTLLFYGSWHVIWQFYGSVVDLVHRPQVPKRHGFTRLPLGEDAAMQSLEVCSHDEGSGGF